MKGFEVSPVLDSCSLSPGPKPWGWSSLFSTLLLTEEPMDYSRKGLEKNPPLRVFYVVILMLTLVTGGAHSPPHFLNFLSSLIPKVCV